MCVSKQQHAFGLQFCYVGIEHFLVTELVCVQRSCFQCEVTLCCAFANITACYREQIEIRDVVFLKIH